MAVGKGGRASAELVRLPKDALDGAGRGLGNASADLAGTGVRYLPPWIVASALPAMAQTCHVLWAGTSTAPWAAAGMTLATVGLTSLTWRISHARRLLGRLHLAANTGLSLGWVTMATITGLHRPVVDIWVGGAFVMGLAWNLRHSLHGTSEDDDRLRSWWASRAADKSGLAGSQMTTKEVGENRGTARLQLVEGQTVKDVTNARDTIASLAGVPATGVRVQPDPEDASVAEVTFVRRDMLRQITTYAGPSYVGGLPTDPHEIATYEDGARLEITLAATEGDAGGEDKNAYHLGIGGKNGSGKSGPVLIIAGDWLCRRESLVFVIDKVKKEQTWSGLSDLLDLFVTTDAGAEALLLAIRDRLVPEISTYLGRKGLKNWVPGCGIPAVLLVIEEALALPDEVKAIIVDLLRQVRSLGINIVLSGQRWTFDGMPTSARAEIVPMQFGCGKGDAGWLLGDLVDQGANPEAWGNQYPGRFYAPVPDVDETRHIVPLRSDKADPEVVGRLVRPHYHHTPMPDLFARALGEVWANRPRYAAPDQSQEGWTPAVTLEPTAHAGTPGIAADGSFDPNTLGLEADEDAHIQPGVNDDVPPLGDFSFAPPPPAPKAAPEKVRAEVLAVIGAWGPGAEFGPTELARALPEHAARSRSTVSRLLAKLLATGALEETGTEGRYRIPHPHAA